MRNLYQARPPSQHKNSPPCKRSPPFPSRNHKPSTPRSKPPSITLPFQSHAFHRQSPPASFPHISPPIYLLNSKLSPPLFSPRDGNTALLVRAPESGALCASKAKRREKLWTNTARRGGNDFIYLIRLFYSPAWATAVRDAESRAGRVGKMTSFLRKWGFATSRKFGFMGLLCGSM